MNQFKIRCSAIGEIMAKPGEDKLPVGAITYIKKWVKEQREFYNRRTEFTSKYTEKGKHVEDDAIDLAADHFGWGMVSKNKRRVSNDFMEGEPDIVLSNSIEDIKASWSHDTFPLFETKLPEKDYEWQLLGYMELFNKDNAGVNYCLMDAPDNIVEAEARKKMYANGMIELEADFYDQVKASMTYSHLPTWLRVKRFQLYRDDVAIQQIKRRVELCREYIDNLIIPMPQPIILAEYIKQDNITLIQTA